MEGTPITIRPKAAYALCYNVPPLAMVGAMVWLSLNLDVDYAPYIYLSGIGLLLFPIYNIAFTMSKKYVLNGEQLCYTRGVFGITTDYLELYRVKDITERRPFLKRLLGAMDLVLVSSDRTHPTFAIRGIAKGDLARRLRDLVEANRRARGVREFD